jgi:hypothetical protein
MKIVYGLIAWIWILGLTSLDGMAVCYSHNVSYVTSDFDTSETQMFIYRVQQPSTGQGGSGSGSGGESDKGTVNPSEPQRERRFNPSTPSTGKRESGSGAGDKSDKGKINPSEGKPRKQ